MTSSFSTYHGQRSDADPDGSGLLTSAVGISECLKKWLALGVFNPSCKASLVIPQPLGPRNQNFNKPIRCGLIRGTDTDYAGPLGICRRSRSLGCRHLASDDFGRSQRPSKASFFRFPRGAPRLKPTPLILKSAGNGRKSHHSFHRTDPKPPERTICYLSGWWLAP